MSTPPTPDSDIAIIGMAGRFPGARTVADYWRNLCAGVESIVSLADDDLRRAGIADTVIEDPHYVKRAAPLADIDQFDAGFFGFSPRDAAILDPQHRFFLECVWEALEDAGHVPEQFTGAVGVFAGCGMSAYFNYHLLPNLELMRSAGLFLVRHTGNDKDFLTTRASYLLNLTGPSVGVQTACSTSLVAVHLACEHLLNFQCDLALAGGVTIELPHRIGYRFEDGEILSPDGHCRPFDSQARGTVFGSGVGIVALRRLADAVADGDHIYAVIKGSAVNNDGSRKVGYLAPSVDGQARAVAEALAMAGVDAASIGYVESHGTGTPVGDPIEVAALTEAYRRQTSATGYCALGSVKSNIGHLDTAAGVASLIKAALAVRDGIIPASLHYTAPNPSIDFPNTPFFVNARTAPWPASRVPRRAGVNSLGVGGTNAHVIVEAPPARTDEAALDGAPEWHVLPLSARTTSSLSAAARALVSALDDQALRLDDVACTLQLGRRRFAHRRAVVGHTRAGVAAALRGDDPTAVRAGSSTMPAPVVFMFPGGGAQYPRMGADLYAHEAAYRKAFDRAHTVATGLGLPDVRALVLGADNREGAAEALARPSASILSVFLVEYALAELWRHRGIVPVAMIGHSLGEYVAALLAGVFSLEDALRIVGVRGEIFERLPRGAMLGIAAAADAIAPRLPAGATIAAINAPEACVVSGVPEALDALSRMLEDRDIDCRPLHISVAAHSAMLDPFLEEFRERISRITYMAPRVPVISNVSGTWATAEMASAEYWTRHLRGCVRFSEGLTRVLDTHRAAVLLEVGPGVGLGSLAAQHAARTAEQPSVASMRHPNDPTSDLKALALATAALWSAGVEVDWSACRTGAGRRVPLPTYCWDHQRYWIDAPPPAFISGQHPEIVAGPTPARESSRPSPSEWIWGIEWTAARPVAAPVVATPPGSVPHTVLVACRPTRPDHAAVIAELRRRGASVVVASEGSVFARHSPDELTIAPEEADDWRRALEELEATQQRPATIIYLLASAIGDSSHSGPGVCAEAVRLGFDGPLALVQALADTGLDGRLLLVTRGALAAAGPVTAPLGALVSGPALAAAAEHPEIHVTHLDLAGREPLAATDVVDAAMTRELGPRLAMRQGVPLVPTFIRRPRPTPEREIRHGGVYWVTGGLGGVSLALAQRLATGYRAKVLLTGRTTLPPVGEWARVAAALPEGDALRSHLEQLAEIERLGGEVLYQTASLADRASLIGALDAVRTRFGPPNGVFHTAGAVDDGPLLTKTLDAAHAVLAPKVEGTLNLVDALGSASLDFLALFSSTSSVLGLEGQVDYISANAFMDAFSGTAALPYPVLAIGWGIWRETGMVARALDAPRTVARSAGNPAQASSTARHPLLGTCVTRTRECVVFERVLETSRWELDEHRLSSGDAVFPGVAYLDVLWAMGRDLEATDRIELSDVTLLQPLVFRDQAVRVLRTIAQRAPDGWTCRVESRSLEGEDDEWCEHATARLGRHDHPRPTAALDVLRATATAPSQAFDADGLNPAQRAHVAFGPRWTVLSNPRQAPRAMVADISLADRFEADLAVPRLHPALLDVAAAAALPTIEGYDDSRDLFAPVQCGCARVYGALPGHFVVHAAASPGATAQADVVTFDIQLYDTDGRLLLLLADFAMRRLSPAHLRDTGARPTPSSPARARLRRWWRHGIGTADGLDVLLTLVTSDVRGHVMVSPMALPAQLDEIRAPRTVLRERTVPRGTQEVAPALSPTEQAIAAVWQQLLDVAGVQPADDFFLLGGHSLIAVRSLSRIEKATGVRLDLAALFEHRTLAAIAGVVDARRGVQLEPTSGVGSPPARRALTPVDRTAYRIARSELSTRSPRG